MTIFCYIRLLLSVILSLFSIIDVNTSARVFFVTTTTEKCNMFSGADAFYRPLYITGFFFKMCDPVSAFYQCFIDVISEVR